MIKIKISQHGSFDKTEKSLRKSLSVAQLKHLDRYGKEGVRALQAATPVDSGTTANSWSYEIERTNEGAAIYWTNSNVNKGVPIALIIQYGHGTGTGGYVAGVDYINPALKKVFERISEDIEKEMSSE